MQKRYSYFEGSTHGTMKGRWYGALAIGGVWGLLNYVEPFKWS